MSKVTIDGTEYDYDNLTEDQQAIVNTIHICDAKIEEHSNQIAITKTARQAYINDLGSQLKNE